MILCYMQVADGSLPTSCCACRLQHAPISAPLGTPRVLVYSSEPSGIFHHNHGWLFTHAARYDWRACRSSTREQYPHRLPSGYPTAFPAISRCAALVFYLGEVPGTPVAGLRMLCLTPKSGHDHCRSTGTHPIRLARTRYLQPELVFQVKLQRPSTCLCHSCRHGPAQATYQLHPVLLWIPHTDLDLVRHVLQIWAVAPYLQDLWATQLQTLWSRCRLNQGRRLLTR